MNTLVMKFGGAAIVTIEQFSHVADIVISRLESYSRLIVVVSARGDTTNQLIELAKQIHPNPPQREYDMLISVGERISMSLLAMALSLKNKEAVSFTGSQSGIVTSHKHTNAQIIDVHPHRLEKCLNQGKIAIVAGFQGISEQKEITTLGRGGSDISAAALAIALGACKLEVFKDVPGIFKEDPKENPKSIQYNHLTYKEALEIARKGAKILHQRALELAAKNGLLIHVRSFKPIDHDNEGTVIYDPERLRETIPRYEEV